MAIRSAFLGLAVALCLPACASTDHEAADARLDDRLTSMQEDLQHTNQALTDMTARLDQLAQDRQRDADQAERRAREQDKQKEQMQKQVAEAREQAGRQLKQTQERLEQQLAQTRQQAERQQERSQQQIAQAQQQANKQIEDAAAKRQQDDKQLRAELQQLRTKVAAEGGLKPAAARAPVEVKAAEASTQKPGGQKPAATRVPVEQAIAAEVPMQKTGGQKPAASRAPAEPAKAAEAPAQQQRAEQFVMLQKEMKRLEQELTKAEAQFAGRDDLREARAAIEALRQRIQQAMAASEAAAGQGAAPAPRTGRRCSPPRQAVAPKKPPEAPKSIN